MRLSSWPFLPRLIWVFALAGMACWIVVDRPIAWDFHVIQQAIHSLRDGHDPYLDGIAVQDSYIRNGAAQHGVPRPFVYVYPPLTLHMLKPLARLPDRAVEAVYWILYVLLVLAQLSVARRSATPRERSVADILLPIPLFFPGLLLFDSVLGGNIAFILFGMVLLACRRGWVQGRWPLFYAAVLFASCFKPPYLTLLAIPLLSARRQWAPVCAAAAAGAGLFAMQAWLWPASFHNYLLATNRIFSFNRDFGSGPAGRAGAALAALHLPYALPSTIFWLASSLAVFLALLPLSRAYLAGGLSREQWIPFMMVGVMLLNPRLIEYEIFPFTFFLALIAHRLISASSRPRLVLSLALPGWIAANCLAEWSRTFWKDCECALLLALFLLGYRQLRRAANLRLYAESVPVPASGGTRNAGES